MKSLVLSFLFLLSATLALAQFGQDNNGNPTYRPRAGLPVRTLATTDHVANSVAGKLNTVDSVAFVRKIAGFRQMSAAEVSKLSSLPPNAIGLTRVATTAGVTGTPVALQVFEVDSDANTNGKAFYFFDTAGQKHIILTAPIN